MSRKRYTPEQIISMLRERRTSPSAQSCHLNISMARLLTWRKFNFLTRFGLSASLRSRGGDHRGNRRGFF